MHVLKRIELVDVPWKNGHGITRSIARGLLGDRVAWTISRADVAQDGPFSDFVGMTRVLTVVSGGAMALQAPAHAIDALMWQPACFDGGLKVHARLTDGPLTDLNLMFDPTICNGTVITRRDPFTGPIRRPTMGLLAFHILAGAPQINAVPLMTADTALFDTNDAALHLGEGDAVLEIRLNYVGHKDAIRLCIAPL